MLELGKKSIALIALVAIFGCNEGNSPTSPATDSLSDTDEIEAILTEEMADYFADDFLEGESDEANKSAEAIEADRWRRIVEKRSGSVAIDFPGDGTAFVTIKRYLEGTLWIADRVDSISTTIYEKPFADSITRYAKLTRRAADTRPPFRRWSVDQISLAEAVSEPVNSVNILSATLKNTETGIAYSYTDPAALLDREIDIPVFESGDEIEVTVDAGRSDLLAFLHTGRHRLPLAGNGDGTYSGSFTVPSHSGVFQAGFDLMTEGTLLDDVMSYDNRGWATLYRVE